MCNNLQGTRSIAFIYYSPVLFSASLNVTSSKTTPWLLPLAFAANTTILKVTSGSRLSKKKYGSVEDVML